MKRIANAHWSGNLKNGSGSLTTGSQTLNQTPYSFAARFESGQGTNPEELLAAPNGEPSTVVADRVAAARERQHRRQGTTNAVLPPSRLDEVSPLAPPVSTFLQAAAQRR